MNYIKQLYVITPFKGNNIERLKVTIYSLKQLKVGFNINHLVIHYNSKFEIIEKIKSIKNTKKYNLWPISIKKPGIYSAINKGLDYLSKDHSYIVLGSGDILKLVNNKQLNLLKEDMTLINYELSSKNKTKLFRNKYLGMPYCHNAIIFKKNSLRYSTKYKISSDYEYFLNYIKTEKIDLQKSNNNINYQIKMIFESELGISSNSIFRKNFENLLICFNYFGLKGVLLNLINNIFKIFLKKS